MPEIQPLFPAPLKENDRVAIVSPSGAVDKTYLQGAVARLKEWGLNPVVGEFAAEHYGRYAGTPEERAQDLQQVINDPDVKAILCSRGGYGAIQIIDQIDFSSFELNPKWLIGFSDITVLHSAITALNAVSIHGVMAKQLTLNAAGDDSLTFLQDILFGKTVDYSLPAHSLNRTGKAKGTLAGGNLSIIQSLRGTYYDIYPENKILFIEDIAEEPYRIDRIIQNLKVGGVLENLSGLIVGQFSEYEEDPTMMKTVYELIADAVADYDYPVCFDFPAGHVSRNLPLILGATHEFEVSENGVKLKVIP
ncbi:MAG: LD-carboxypeptidase [Prevotellaceae bacterium]|jgi:muramoyltetrapeptide carboxypeptidase|nr:LD-carboxypeptidase [Prevotellaceae bacterium]